jgi:hypothetical protein
MQLRILGGLLSLGMGDKGWRIAFIAGLILAPFIAILIQGACPRLEPHRIALGSLPHIKPLPSRQTPHVQPRICRLRELAGQHWPVAVADQRAPDLPLPTAFSCNRRPQPAAVRHLVSLTRHWIEFIWGSGVRPYAAVVGYSSKLKGMFRRATSAIVDIRDPVQVAYNWIAARELVD